MEQQNFDFILLLFHNNHIIVPLRPYSELKNLNQVEILCIGADKIPIRCVISKLFPLG